MMLAQRIEDGEVIIRDGVTGTELEKRGVLMDDAAWCAAALAAHPDVVREVHKDYTRAGTDVTITNIFPAAKHVLEEAGLGERFRELNSIHLLSDSVTTPSSSASPEIDLSLKIGGVSRPLAWILAGSMGLDLTPESPF